MGSFSLVLQKCVAERGEEQRRGLPRDAGEGEHAAGDDARRCGSQGNGKDGAPCGTPSPRAASRMACGTMRSISSVVRVTVGTIMMPSATPPGKRGEVFLRHHYQRVDGDAHHDRRNAIEHIGGKTHRVGQRVPCRAQTPPGRCRRRCRWECRSDWRRTSTMPEPTMAFAMPPPALAAAPGCG